MTAWLWEVCSGKLEAFYKIWDWAKENLTAEEIKK
jgi:endo-1,4-beta-D-glucanase Y